MQNLKTSHFFLGANSPTGFSSLYDQFIDPLSGEFLWIIKGGPGCGKSTFMKQVADTAIKNGYAVEKIHCSGDPDSLDGIRIPALHTAYVDGTAPHTLDATYPAAAMMYLDLGAFYDTEALRDYLPEIAEINRRYKALYHRAYALIAAASACDVTGCPDLCTDAAIQTTLHRAKRTAARILESPRAKPAAIQHRFYSAFTCKGWVRMEETLSGLCSQIFGVENRFGLAPVFLQTIADEVIARGLPAIFCHDPMHPDELEALLLPDSDTAFLALRSPDTFSGTIRRHIRLDRLIAPQHLQALRPELRHAEKLQAQLLADAHQYLQNAKVLHDTLETIYNPYVDFDAVRKLASQHCNML
ncbi:MAG: hypothetical protein ACOX7K_08980 [Oscillospiraceae bacterium]|jgi:hypothetical protein